jgi:hypothetical protein
LHEALGELLPAGWRDAAPFGFPHQVELAVTAGVFRAQTPQASTDAVVDYVMRSRSHSLLDDLGDLAAMGVDGVVQMLGPVYGDSNVLGVPVLRAAVIHRAATALVATGVRSGEDLRTAAAERPDAVETAVLGVRGLGRVTWEWIAFLSQVRLRADPALNGFVRRTLDEPDLTPEETSEILRLTARRFACDERNLAHAIRELLRERVG